MYKAPPKPRCRKIDLWIRWLITYIKTSEMFRFNSYVLFWIMKDQPTQPTLRKIHQHCRMVKLAHGSQFESPPDSPQWRGGWANGYRATADGIPEISYPIMVCHSPSTKPVVFGSSIYHSHTDPDGGKWSFRTWFPHGPTMSLRSSDHPQGGVEDLGDLEVGQLPDDLLRKRIRVVEIVPGARPGATKKKQKRRVEIRVSDGNYGDYSCLVGGLGHPSEKYESQLGWLFPIYGKIKNGNQTTNQLYNGCLAHNSHQPVRTSPSTIPFRAFPMVHLAVGHLTQSVPLSTP